MARKTPIERYRNIGIFTHNDDDRTTFRERILFYTDANHTNGEARGITITSPATTGFWKGMDQSYLEHPINLVDAPSHRTLVISEARRPMQVLDGACMVYSAIDKVRFDLETMWRRANKHNVPRLVFVDKMDRPGADFFRVRDEISSVNLSARPVPVVIPIGAGDDFKGVVDLLKMKAILWDEASLGMKFEYHDIPAELVDAAKEWRGKLVEAAAEATSDLRHKHRQGNLSEDDLKLGLRTRTLANQIQPMLCGTALKHKGVQRMLDAVVDYLPSPVDILPVFGTDKNGGSTSRNADDGEKFSALAFKQMTAPSVGQLTFVRVYSGVLSKGDTVYNADKRKEERIGGMVRMHAHERQEVEELRAGDIAACVGLTDVAPGETLCAPDAIVRLDVEGPAKPMLDLAVEPKTQTEQEKLGIALRRLAEEEPSLRVKTDDESGRTVISGMSDLHLELIVDRLKRESGVKINVGKPQVAYRATLRETVEEVEGKFMFKGQSDGQDQYGHVVLRLEPTEEGTGIEFVDASQGGVIPREFIPAVEKGIYEAATQGVLAGYPVVGVKVTLLSGSHRDGESNEMAFKLAAIRGFKEGCRKADLVILEPVTTLEVEAPADSADGVYGWANPRRGTVILKELAGPDIVLTAHVPLSEMSSYLSSLRQMTGGQAFCTMDCTHYEEAPPEVAEAIKAAHVR